MNNTPVITLLLVAVVALRCSPPVAPTSTGGSSDHGSGICATIYSSLTRPNGDPATGAHVHLLPDSLNYAADSSSTRIYTAVTDSSGNFEIDSVPEGTYCLFASDSWSQTMLKKTLIITEHDSVITTKPLRLSATGTIYIDIDTMNIKPGTIIYFPGLPLFHLVDSSRIQSIINIPSGTLDMNGYIPANDSVFEIGIEYRLEVLPGMALFLPYRLSPPWHLIDSTAGEQKLTGSAGLVYRFSALDPAEKASSTRCQYRFSWGDGSISPWSAKYIADFIWNKPGNYYVQTQLMVDDNTCLAWSEATLVVITGE